MIKVIQSIIFILLLSSCHQGSSYMSRYGQSIVLNPSETRSISGNTETISDQKLTSLIKPNTEPNKIKTFDQNTFKNINFSSTKFLKGNADCISIIRVKVGGSLSYDELMYELKKRAQTMGGNAIGIYDLDENKEVIYANKEIDVKNSFNVRYEFMKQTNLLSSVTADIFRCKSNT